MSHIELQDVGHRFAPRGRGGAADDPTAGVVLRDVDLTIERGEFFVLAGPSGCGKSTLLDFVAGLTTPTSGRITVDGELVTGPGLDRGYIFQQYALLPWRTALANVEFGLAAAGVRGRSARREKARQYLDLVGLAAFENHYPHELSGGMKQRVAIARSLAYEPDVLLMDEPFAALDAQTRETLQAELVRIWAQTGTTVVFVTHSIEEAVFLGQRVAVLTAGPGTVKEIVTVPTFDRTAAGDVRASAEFAEARHAIWTLLQEEVLVVQERSRVAEVVR